MTAMETLLEINAQATDFLNVPVLEQMEMVSPAGSTRTAELFFLAPSELPGSLGLLDHYEIF